MPDFFSHRTIFNIKEDKIYKSSLYIVASQVVLVVKNLSANAGDIKGMGSIPGSGFPPSFLEEEIPPNIHDWRIP